MGFRSTAKASDDLDGLRLLALSRIPRCGTCPRFSTLVEAYAQEQGQIREIGAVPAGCTHQVCAPLVARFRPVETPLRARSQVSRLSPASLRREAGLSPR